MKKFRVNEVFSSIQGEGPLVGSLAIFIRFSGCNLSCKFCDTEHEPFEELTGEELLNKVRECLVKLGYRPESLYPLPYTYCQAVKSQLKVVLTGGEPLLQVNQKLVKDLKALGLLVCVETNGSKELLTEDRKSRILNLLDMCDEVTVSPKVRAMSIAILQRASCLKVLCPIKHVERLDEEIIRVMSGSIGALTTRVLQPVTPGLITHRDFAINFEASVKLALRWGVDYGEDWRVIPQVHKFLNIP